MSEQEIPPLDTCPFCKGEAILETLQPGLMGDTRHFARCRCCGAEGPWFKNPLSAAKAWNERAIGEHTQKMLDYWNDLALCSCDQWDTEFFEFVENFLKEYGRKVGS